MTAEAYEKTMNGYRQKLYCIGYKKSSVYRHVTYANRFLSTNLPINEDGAEEYIKRLRRKGVTGRGITDAEMAVDHFVMYFNGLPITKHRKLKQAKNNGKCNEDCEHCLYSDCIL